MNKTNDSLEENREEQSKVDAIELLKDSIGYNEFEKFYESVFEKKNRKDKDIEKRIAAIVSVGTLFFWLCKAIYFSYLSGVNGYYGIANKYIYVNENLGYQIFQYITVVLIVGIITIVFMNIWLEQSSVKKKIIKSIGQALLEMIFFLGWTFLYTYGFQPKKVINEIINYSRFEKISLAVLLIGMWLVVHYYGIAILFSHRKRTTKKQKIFGGDIDKNKNVQKKKERKPLLKSNVGIMVVLSAFLAVGAWIFGGVNEMLRTEYDIIVCSTFDEENTDEEYILENDGKRYVAYVVITDTSDYFLCKRLTNKYTISSNGQSFIKKEGAEIIKVSKHFDKN